MDRIIDLYARCLEYDIQVLSEPWIYYWFVPACFYVAFFFVKWTVLTFPFWGPVAIVAQSYKPIRLRIKKKPKKDKKEKETN